MLGNLIGNFTVMNAELVKILLGAFCIGSQKLLDLLDLPGGGILGLSVPEHLHLQSAVSHQRFAVQAASQVVVPLRPRFVVQDATCSGFGLGDLIDSAIDTFTEALVTGEKEAINIIFDVVLTKIIEHTPFKDFERQLMSVVKALGHDFLDVFSFLTDIVDAFAFLPRVLFFTPLLFCWSVLSCAVLSHKWPLLGRVCYLGLVLAMCQLLAVGAALYFFGQALLEQYGFALKFRVNTYVLLLDCVAIELLLVSSYMLYTLEDNEAAHTALWLRVTSPPPPPQPQPKAVASATKPATAHVSLKKFKVSDTDTNEATAKQLKPLLSSKP
jgi:hypothetical protein